MGIGDPARAAAALAFAFEEAALRKATLVARCQPGVTVQVLISARG